MKKFLCILALIASLTSCVKAKDFNPYSPLDTYLKASIERADANAKAQREAKAFIDSLNSTHIYNHKN